WELLSLWRFVEGLKDEKRRGLLLGFYCADYGPRREATYVTRCGSPVPVEPSCCRPGPRSWRSWHSPCGRDRARVRNLRPRRQWVPCAESHRLQPHVRLGDSAPR